ncbi:Enoyl-CoA delta isomerase 1, peroxisomal [Trichoplax sp. H2]|uniref:Uncharacterized protein n=1 Tax=Trichoplax adhaerens TaxID=10228 RepID=B3RK88_TRIAD|nr:hypothetical protein TRIADDRAFT_52755 [Trichoplax adhaerens]EDV29883.1 hypothetical protein TRIADDRAFT_52755 [Trichoplax adhaerens]RDD40854.1 Enoyl-CoA delta isomerase 1, peroxisomal [Trichoplax sp. H2]|eukprot:XP_002109085.1 hypothetical protein TRIADDRAFT_52755 [Trichoplax adhaerens]
MKAKVNIRVEYEGSCSIIVMDAGENRINDDFVKQFHAALDEVEKNDDAKVLITTGTGKYYSNGLDLDWLKDQTAQRMTELRFTLNNLLARILTFKLPTIAAANGHCFAGGGLLFLAHDYRIMRKERGWFCLPEIHLKMTFPPFWTQIYRYRISDKNVLRDIVYLGKRFTADEAVKSKFVDLAIPGDQLLKSAIQFGEKQLAKANLSPEVLHSLKLDMFESELKYSKL